MNRRDFVKTGGLLGAALAAQSVTTTAKEKKKTSPAATLTTISYNIYAARMYPKTDENTARLLAMRPQFVERLAQELALYQPDIVTFQESPSEKIVARITSALKMNHVRFEGGWPGTILTRFPVVSHENCPLTEGERPEDLFTRHWGRAVLETDSGPLTVFSAHLHPADPAIREREVGEMLKVMAPVLDGGGSILFQGDLNHKPDGPEYERWKDAGFIDAFDVNSGSQPFTIPCTGPHARIDYILTHGPLAEGLRDFSVLFEGGFRTNPEDPKSVALSDHLPVMARIGL